MLECPGWYLHRYHEDLDITLCYPINIELIKEIKRIGWILGDKLAEGSSADVFNVMNAKAVLIIPGNTDANYQNISKKLEVAKEFPTIFPKIYDYFTLDIPYSLDYNYIESTGRFNNKVIQVIKKMDMTLDVYLLRMKNEYPHLLNDIINTLLEKLIYYLTTLRHHGITYTDLKLDNVGVSISIKRVKIKLLDIEGLHLSYHYEYDPKKYVDNFYKYDIIPLID